MSNSIPSLATHSKLASLEGWRAFSILLVLGTHSTGMPFLSPLLRPAFVLLFDGNLGVRIFFILSGFLITWLMLLENKASGKIHLGHFYIRRALRILPVYFTFLLVLALLQIFTPLHRDTWSWIGNLTFTTNFIRGMDVFGMHLWSLAVEEQFYILWPLLFVFFRLAGNGRKPFLILLIPVIVCPVFRVLAYMGWYPAAIRSVFGSFSFLCYADSLAIGCACAFIYLRRDEWLVTCLTKKRKRVFFSMLAICLVTMTLMNLKIVGIVTVPFNYTLQGFAFAILLMQSMLLPTWGFYRVLNWPLVCGLGVLSYSIYIWQQFFWIKPSVFGLSDVWLNFPGWLVPVLALSFISYHCLEKPLFKLRSRFRDT